VVVVKLLRPSHYNPKNCDLANQLAVQRLAGKRGDQRAAIGRRVPARSFKNLMLQTQFGHLAKIDSRVAIGGNAFAPRSRERPQ
jgi:hypothetical protein